MRCLSTSRKNPGHLFSLFATTLLLSFPALSGSTDSSPVASTSQPSGGYPDYCDIAPFALPNHPPNELRFEEPRDVACVVVDFKGPAPDDVKLSYLQKYWPRTRIEGSLLKGDMKLGWFHQDDLFNSKWLPAATVVTREGEHRVRIQMKPVTAEFSEWENLRKNYDVTFRRTLGVRVEAPPDSPIAGFKVFTTSAPANTRLHVELDAGNPTPSGTIRLSGYNATIGKIEASAENRIEPAAITFTDGQARRFDVTIDHMDLAHDYSGDEGLVTFEFGEEAATVSLHSLQKQGPIWSEDFGLFITSAGQPMTFEDYREGLADQQTIEDRVRSLPEQSLAGASRGQPRAHAVGANLACPYARQRFWVEPNGDILLRKEDVDQVKGRDTEFFKGKASARFLFGLDQWDITTRYTEPLLVYNLHARRRGVVLDQKSFAAPLMTTMQTGQWRSDDPMVALVRFDFRNDGAKPMDAILPVSYTQDSPDRMGGGPEDYATPPYKQTALSVKDNHLLSDFEGQAVLRAAFESTMKAEAVGGSVRFIQTLQPEESCRLVLKIPFVSLENAEERQGLAALEYDVRLEDMTDYWRERVNRGASVLTPDPQLEALHAAHLAHAMISDFEMPDDKELINTSVGTSRYGNYTNESCMIIHDLDQRGLHEEASRRLAVWLKYQGTVGQAGNFTDHRGMFYGAGGFEEGQYNQHHGWALWAFAEHYFLTRDEEWLRKVAGPLIEGADWVFRQRANTMKSLPNSRGWEHGFLPAGSLEDVTDFFYWTSTNAFTWRGTDSVAAALEAIGHPEAARIRREADAYRADLIRGLETARKTAPLVRLRDGRWVPDYPSRLYRRGREVGWIRQTLEGSVNLLISGLYDPTGREAGWILDDHQDNRYSALPFGYEISYFEMNWFDRAGFSMQPNLLAGLLPYLDRDEPEIYIWMFLNAWSACYRQEINAMTEHPMPWLGYSNSANVKTSDEANATSWLRYMFVYTTGDRLYLGLAVPRAWFDQDAPIGAHEVATPFGKVGVVYEPATYERVIRATASLDLERDPGQIQLRIRHPERQAIASVLVNGKEWTKVDRQSGDIDLTGLTGEVKIEARYD